VAFALAFAVAFALTLVIVVVVMIVIVVMIIIATAEGAFTIAEVWTVGLAFRLAIVDIAAKAGALTVVEKAPEALAGGSRRGQKAQTYQECKQKTHRISPQLVGGLPPDKRLVIHPAPAATGAVTAML
jgi:hypothetical protein